MLALVTCVAARDLDTDMPLLLPLLPEAAVAAWDDPTVDWSQFDTVVIRSAWNYHERRDDFLAWLNRVARDATVWNPPATVEWNTDKTYLARFAADGFPVVPTTFVAPGETFARDAVVGDVVVKPSIGAGSNGVVRTRSDPGAASAHVGRLHRTGRTAMIQPYLGDVDEHGETGLVYLGGELSHGFSKSAILAGPVAWEGDLYAVEQVRPHRPTTAECALGDRIVEAVGATAYARIDLLPTPDGPLVVEIELTEPSLFLECDDGAPARAAAAFRSLDA